VGQKISGDTGAFNYVLDASRYSTDGWRDHSAAQKDNINARVGFKLGADTQAVLVLNRVNLPDAQDAQGVNLAGLATPKAVPAAVLTFDTRKSTAQTQLGLAIDHRFNAEHAIKLMGYGGTRDITQFLSVAVGAQGNTSAGGVIDFGRDYKGMEGRYTFKRNLANGPLLVHAGFTSDRLVEERRGFNNFIGTTLGVQGDPKREETNTLKANDQYLQAQWWPAADLSMHAGVRRSRIGLQSDDRFIRPGTPPNPDDSGSLAFSGTTPMLGLLYNLNDRVNLYASWGKGFDAPTLNEVAYEQNGATGLNLILKPSRSQQFELGAKFQLAQATSLQAAVFQAKTEDEIVVRSNNGGRSRFQNAGGTKRDGLELAYNNQFAKGWKTQWAYTYINATYSDAFSTCATTTCTNAISVPVAAGNLLPGIPKQNLFADLAWSSADGGIQAGVEWRATSKVAVNDTNSEFAAGYGTLAARVSFTQKVGNWTWREFVRVDNLTSKSYAGSVIVNQAAGQYYEPSPTRNWLLGVVGSYKF
jgi:iron complex outermembrane receptor protein